MTEKQRSRSFKQWIVDNNSSTAKLSRQLGVHRSSIWHATNGLMIGFKLAKKIEALTSGEFDYEYFYRESHPNETFE